MMDIPIDDSDLPDGMRRVPQRIVRGQYDVIEQTETQSDIGLSVMAAAGRGGERRKGEGAARIGERGDGAATAHSTYGGRLSAYAFCTLPVRTASTAAIQAPAL